MVIRWHHLRRGGYQPPGCFPHGETTSAQSADNGTIKHFTMKFSGIMSERGTFCNIGTSVWPIRFCPKTCHVGGRLIAAPTFGACNVGGWMISAPTLACARWQASATELPAQKFRGVVGAAISRPVVSPMGKQRRRKAPTMQYQTFANAIRRYHVETWYILQYRNPGLANTVLPKNLPRWRAANSRPYVWCVQRWQASATELPAQKYRCANEVLRDLLYYII